MLEEEDSNDVISHRELCKLQPLGEHRQEQGGLLCQDVGGCGCWRIKIAMMISHWKLCKLQPLGEHQQEQGGLWCQDVVGCWMLEEEDSDDDKPLGIT